jgi:hypothetical protein
MTKREPVIEVMDDDVAEILRNKTDVERLIIGFQMLDSARVILRAAIQSEHPDWDEVKTNREIARRMSGGAIADEFA